MQTMTADYPFVFIAEGKIVDQVGLMVRNLCYTVTLNIKGVLAQLDIARENRAFGIGYVCGKKGRIDIKKQLDL